MMMRRRRNCKKKKKQMIIMMMMTATMMVLRRIRWYAFGDVTSIGKVKVKVKFTLEQTTKAQSGSGGTALLFL
jgi:hypothetical protein